MFNYQPKTEQELVEQNLLQKGDGQFEILDALCKKSRTSGNPMIELKVKVWDSTGRAQILFDYLVTDPAFEYKLRHFCESAGLTKEYENGTFNESLCVGRCGTCRIGIKIDKKGEYPPKNSIVDYLKPSVHDDANKSTDEFNYDIPF